MRTCPSTPIFLTLALLLIGMSSQVAARISGWDEVDYKGKPYVTAQSLKAFYRFDTYKADKGHLFFSSPDRVMRTRKGTKDLYINNTKFVLSEFVAAHSAHQASEHRLGIGNDDNCFAVRAAIGT